MPLSNAVLLVVLGLLPSLVWLSYLIKRDLHPEPRYLVTKVFLMGIIVSPLAILFQMAFTRFGAYSSLEAFSAGTPSFFLWAAFVEEFIKFYAVRMVVLTDPEFDEPVDAMIYMMVAGLGFAAIENILVLFRTIPDGTQAALTVWTLRSTGATLLHALSSSLVGYFLAMSWFFRDHRRKLLVIGLVLATMFHFSFNMFLSSSAERLSGLAYATGLLLAMSFLVALLFDRIKQRHARLAVPAAVVSEA